MVSMMPAIRPAAYRILYQALAPALPLFRWLLPNVVLTTESLGRAMLTVARQGVPKAVLEVADMSAIARNARDVPADRL